MRYWQSLLSATIYGALAMTLAACSSPASLAPTDAAATGSERPAWTYGAMVVAANPYAVDAAAAVLARGGHAVDAAIAAHAVLGLVEPESSGLGGGAFMLVYDHASRQIQVYDGRETAPAGADPDMFMVDGKTMGFLDAWQSGIAIGVPGTVALYKAAHDEHGLRPWAEVLQPAIELADDGFVVSAKLANWLQRIARYSQLDENINSAAYFYPGGEPLPVGYLRDNPDLANTLRRIVAEGPAAFYQGSLATQIAAAAQTEPRAGTLSTEDIAAYEVSRREAVCGGFRQYRICSAPPPSSGLAQIMIAGLYDRLATRLGNASEQDRVRAFVDAQRLAYADRDHYVADSAFAAVPVEALIDPRYLDARAKQRFAPEQPVSHGDPGLVLSDRAVAGHWAPDTTAESEGTTHLSIIDQYGNAVSMTATVEAPFGSARMVGGFLLNNEMTDFARDPRQGDLLAANAPAPGKRPRSSMSPLLVFDENGELFMVNGSPGGNSIVAYVAKATLGILAWGQDVQTAVDQPNIVARGNQVRVEASGEEGKRQAALLSAMGYDVKEVEGENSGLHVIVVRKDKLEGGADSRREGKVGAIRTTVDQP